MASVCLVDIEHGYAVGGEGDLEDSHGQVMMEGETMNGPGRSVSEAEVQA